MAAAGWFDIMRTDMFSDLIRRDSSHRNRLTEYILSVKNALADIPLSNVNLPRDSRTETIP